MSWMSFLPFNLQCQSTTGKPSGLVVLFYRHSMSTPRLTNIVKALKEEKENKKLVPYVTAVASSERRRQLTLKMAEEIDFEN